MARLRRFKGLPESYGAVSRAPVSNSSLAPAEVAAPSQTPIPAEVIKHPKTTAEWRAVIDPELLAIDAENYGYETLLAGDTATFEYSADYSESELEERSPVCLPVSVKARINRAPHALVFSRPVNTLILRLFEITTLRR